MEESWDEDFPLTQDQLDLIDGVSTQEQLQMSCNNVTAATNGIDNFQLMTRPINSSRFETPTKSQSSRNSRTREAHGGRKEFSSPSRDSLLAKIDKLQQELFAKSGMLVIKEDEHKREKDRLIEEQKRLRTELSTLTAEFNRTTESLRSQLLFQTKECEEVQLQLRKFNDEKLNHVCESSQSSQQQTSPFKAKSPKNGQLSPVLDATNGQQSEKAVSPNGFPTALSFHSPLSSPVKTPVTRRKMTVRSHQKRFSDASTSTFKTPPAKRFAVVNGEDSPGMILDSPESKLAFGQELQVSFRKALESAMEQPQPQQQQQQHQQYQQQQQEQQKTVETQEKQQSPVLVRALEQHHAWIMGFDGHDRQERKLAKQLVSLQNEMVAEKIDFSVLPQLRTYERNEEISHPLGVRSEENFTKFNSCYHRFVSSTLFGEQEEMDSGKEGSDEEAEEEEPSSGDEIRDWRLVLQMLPCLANHIRLFANQLLRRRTFVESIDGDLTLAAKSTERMCPLTGTGPMDEFFDIVKELDWTGSEDVNDCPHVLHPSNLTIFRRQVFYSLRWILVIHQFCARVRPWIHGEPVDLLPLKSEVAENVTRLLSNLRFYFPEELPIKREALDVFTDLCREMRHETKIKALREVKPFQLLLMSSDERILSTLHCFEALRYLVGVESVREDFNYHGGRKHCLWSVVFHIINKVLDDSSWEGKAQCFLINQFASFAIAAARSHMQMVDRSCCCYRGMYEALSSAALSQARLMFENSWTSYVIEAVERPLRALLFLLQSQGVQHFEEITTNLFPLFTLISMLKRIETCRHYDQGMKSQMDMQLINEFDDLDDEFNRGE